MPKRKHDVDYYIKKLKHIEKSLKRKRQEQASISSDAEDTPFQDQTDDENDSAHAQIVSEAENVITTQVPSDVVDPVEPIAEVPITSPDVLQALGDLMPEKPSFGPPINNDLARIWSTILKNGLPKENKDKLLDKLVPENCSLLKAPKLNPEIMASISDTIVNRDKKIELEQNQLGVGLTILSTALSSLINNDQVDRLNIISVLSEAGRVLTDLYHVQTKSRKNLVFPVLDKKFLDVIKDVERDEYLYGTNLTEKIKALQSVQRSGKTIKKVVPDPRRQGNSNGPPRFNQRKTMSKGGQKRTLSSTYPRKYQGQQYQSTARKPRALPPKQPVPRP